MRPNEDIPDWFTLVPYFAGTCSAEERTALEKWIAGDSNHQRAVDQLRRAWEMRGTQGPLPVDQSEIVNRVMTTIQAGRSEPERARSSDELGLKRASARYTASWWLGSRTLPLGFLTVLGIACIAGGLQYRIVRARRGADSAPRHYETAAGQRSTVHLANGIEIALAPASVVTIARARITLLGEAHFAVPPHTSIPLVVQTQSAVVAVLGTQFSVRQYTSERLSRVVVDEGKVSLRAVHDGANHSSHSLRVLTANMMGRVTDSTVTVAPITPDDQYIGWIRGRLIFNRVQLRDIMTELARAYNVELRIADTVLAARPMTMTVSVDTEPITRILDVISVTNKAHVTRMGDVFVLASGQGAPPHLRVNPSLQLEKSYGR